MVAEPRNRATTSYNENTEEPSDDHDDDMRVPLDENGDVEVHIELVIIDGPEGTRLQELQAAAIDRTLRALFHARSDIPKGDQR
jgi:hypothetical protein